MIVGVRGVEAERGIIDGQMIGETIQEIERNSEAEAEKGVWQICCMTLVLLTTSPSGHAGSVTIGEDTVEADQETERERKRGIEIGQW